MTEHIIKTRPDMLGTITWYCLGCDWRFNSFDGDKGERAKFAHLREVGE